MMLLFHLVVEAQTAKEILQKSKTACLAIEQGTYQMESFMKYMDNSDTSYTCYDCTFKKMKEDTVFSSFFHFTMLYDTTYLGHILYNGNEYAYSNEDSVSLTVISMEKWADEVQARKHNLKFFTPFTTKKAKPLPADSMFEKPNGTYTRLADQIINGQSVFVVKESIIPELDSGEMIQVLSRENTFWISKNDNIPIQFDELFILTLGQDTMHQYELTKLNKHNVNQKVDNSVFELTSIPASYKRKEYTPWVAPELLSQGEMAPKFSLVNLKGDSVRLDDFKGKLVLIDFFYKGCYPCIQALPSLQALHKKFEKDGLVLLGIDPYDDLEKDKIDEFMQKQGVTYTVLLATREIPKQYHVSAYPTMYLIDKQGAVLSTQVGYGPDVEADLEKRIEEALHE